jgi:hypothetical protein
MIASLDNSFNHFLPHHFEKDLIPPIIKFLPASRNKFYKDLMRKKTSPNLSLWMSYRPILKSLNLKNLSKKKDRLMFLLTRNLKNNQSRPKKEEIIK